MTKYIRALVNQNDLQNNKIYEVVGIDKEGDVYVLDDLNDRHRLYPDFGECRSVTTEEARKERPELFTEFIVGRKYKINDKSDLYGKVGTVIRMGSDSLLLEHEAGSVAASFEWCKECLEPLPEEEKPEVHYCKERGRPTILDNCNCSNQSLLERDGLTQEEIEAFELPKPKQPLSYLNNDKEREEAERVARARRTFRF